MTTQDKLAQALRDGLDAAEARLQERQSSLAGYPYKWRVEQESVDNLRAVLAEYESAHSAPAAPAVEPWQPIETAPKDGRTLLLGRYNEAGNWRTMCGTWMSAEYIADNWEDPDSGDPGWHETSVEADDEPNCWAITPTHWMPLPAAPGAQPAPAQQPDCCPICGSDCNERDELIKAEREIERLRTSQQALDSEIAAALVASAKWSPAPIKTEWGPHMMVADVELSRDETLTMHATESAIDAAIVRAAAAMAGNGGEG
jgi:hypothetical protein